MLVLMAWSSVMCGPPPAGYKGALATAVDVCPTRHDVFHNTDSAIDLTICSSFLRLDYQWAVDQNDHGNDHWPIHLKYVKNIPSPCLPKWKMGEADWGLFNKSTEINHEVNDFQSSTAAYEYLVY